MINLLASGFKDWFYSPEFVFGIYKYAICILTGIILAYFVCTKEGERMGISKDEVLVCATIIVPCCILGARLWYMFGDGIPTLKGNISSYGFFEGLWESILDFIGYANGRIEISGLAIHGGIAVAIVGILVSCRVKKWRISQVIDMVGPGFLIGQICGRWGNFFNQEAYGIVVGGWDAVKDGSGYVLTPKLTLAEQYDKLVNKFHVPKFIANNMKIYSGSHSYYYGVVNGVQTYGELTGYNYFHPTFLYESGLNLIGLILYFILRRRKSINSGEFGGLYLIWYGIVRFFIEIIRTDSLYIGNTSIKMAQLTSILMVVGGLFLVIYFKFIKKSPKYVDLINENKNKNKEEKVEEEVVLDPSK